MSQRVTHIDTAASADGDGSTTYALVPGRPSSELALSTVAVGAGGSHRTGHAEHDTFLFCFEGAGALTRDGDVTPLEPGSTALLPAGGQGVIAGGPEGLAAIEATVGPACDLHAPMGALSRVEQLNAIEPGKATGARSFQVLYDAANGSTRATLFVGHIPPGKAPWHYHLYDEIVWVLAGEGRLHLGDTPEPLVPGSAFRLYPREVHIVENTSPDRELSVLGLFTPAGSPSAAYLMPAVFADYTAAPSA